MPSVPWGVLHDALSAPATAQGSNVDPQEVWSGHHRLHQED